MTKRLLSYLGSLGLLGAMVGYFAVSCTLSLEYIDEGQILYPSWLTSLGAVPYKDFGHMYGPALFFLNGALLRWIEPDLIVVRSSLVVLKTVTVALSYLLARRVASRAFALLACAVLAGVWGTPWWMFNTPYANHYSLTLTLAGLLVFLSLPRHFRLACLLAGFCFGCAATFKQTAGFFACSGFALFLILARDTLRHGQRPTGPPLPDWCVRLGRIAVLAGMLAVFLLYLGRRNTTANVVVLLTPAVLTIGWAAMRDLRGPVQRGMRVGLWGLLHAAVGAAFPTLAVGAYYAAQGLLPEVNFYLGIGLPQKVTVFEPYPLPSPRTALVSLLLIALFAAVVRRRPMPRAAPPREPASGAMRTKALVAGGLGMAFVVILVASAALGIVHVDSWGWQGRILTMWFVVPPAAVWLSGVFLLRSVRRDALDWSDRRTALVLLYCNGVTALILLYPVADIPHLLMGLPAFAPLCAFLLARIHASATRALPGAFGAAYLSGGSIAALVALLLLPSADYVRTTLSRSRVETPTLSRATGIHGAQPKVGEVAALLSYLATAAPPQEKLLVLNGEQLLYFLAGRRSALEPHEFVFYLVVADMLSDEDARRVVDEERAVERLAATRPVIIEGGDRRTHGRLRKAYEQVSRYIDAHYDVAATIGDYQVLTWVK
jgi:hypothetical protein